MRSFVHSFVRSIIHSFVRSSVRSFVRSCVHAFFRSFTRSIDSSFIHSFIHSFSDDCTANLHSRVRGQVNDCNFIVSPIKDCNHYFDVSSTDEKH